MSFKRISNSIKKTLTERKGSRKQRKAFEAKMVAKNNNEHKINKYCRKSFSKTPSQFS